MPYVCRVYWSALLSSPSSAAASPAPSEDLFSPVQRRRPPPVSSARPAPCMHAQSSLILFKAIPSWYRSDAASLTSSWVAAPLVALAAALIAPRHWRRRRKRRRMCLKACYHLSRSRLRCWRGRGCCRGAAGDASGETGPTGRLLGLSGCSRPTESDAGESKREPAWRRNSVKNWM